MEGGSTVARLGSSSSSSSSASFNRRRLLRFVLFLFLRSTAETLGITILVRFLHNMSLVGLDQDTDPRRKRESNRGLSLSWRTPCYQTSETASITGKPGQESCKLRGYNQNPFSEENLLFIFFLFLALVFKDLDYIPNTKIRSNIQRLDKYHRLNTVHSFVNRSILRYNFRTKW